VSSPDFNADTLARCIARTDDVPIEWCEGSALALPFEECIFNVALGQLSPDTRGLPLTASTSSFVHCGGAAMLKPLRRANQLASALAL
jgi:hypothetical protein